jgi:hypothetical protein
MSQHRYESVRIYTDLLVAVIAQSQIIFIFPLSMLSRYDLASSEAYDWTSSPLSNYSNASASLHRPSISSELDEHSESEYEAIAEAMTWHTSEVGKWPNSMNEQDGVGQLPPWALAGKRKGSIIAISPRGSLGSPSRPGTPRRLARVLPHVSPARRGSDASLLGSELASPGRDRRRSQTHHLLQEVLDRRRSSVVSAVSEISMRGPESLREREQINKIRSMDELRRRFSDVVEVIPASPDTSPCESEEDRDYTPDVIGGRRGAINVWSPDTSSDYNTDDESELQSLPPLPTPDIRQQAPSVLSNFPLRSVAVDTTSERRQLPFPQLDSAFNNNTMGSPSPEMETAEFLRRLRAPTILRGWNPPTEISQPSTSRTVKRSRSSPLFSSGPVSNDLFRARSKGRPERSHVQFAAIPDEKGAIVADDTSNSEKAEVTADHSGTEIRKHSFASGVEEFGFLASEISMGTPRMPRSTSPQRTPRAVSSHHLDLASLQLPGSAFQTPSVSTPTPRFDAMAAFLGKTPLSSPAVQSATNSPDYIRHSSVKPHSPRDEFATPMIMNKARPLSLQPPARTVVQEPIILKARPRSGGLAISNANLPSALSAVPTWTEQWTSRKHFAQMSPPIRPGPMNRSVTSPAVVTVPGNKIARKAVPVYSPSIDCDASEGHSPESTAIPCQGHLGTGSLSNDSKSTFSPVLGGSERDERERRRQRRAERRKCRRCEEKRALRILVDAAKLTQDIGRSPLSVSTGQFRNSVQGGHHHSQHHHSQAQETRTSVAPSLPLPEPPRQSIGVPLADRSLPDYTSPRPTIARQNTTDIIASTQAQQKVTYAAAPVKDRYPVHSRAPSGSGGNISGPILLSSTSNRSDVQRAIEESVASRVEPHHQRPIVAPVRPSLMRSASTSVRIKTQGPFSRLLHAFDHRSHHAAQPDQQHPSRQSFSAERPIRTRASMYQFSSHSSGDPHGLSVGELKEFYRGLKTKGSLSSPPLPAQGERRSTGIGQV